MQATAAAVVFTDSETGQGYIRTLSDWETNLILSQLQALDDGPLKAYPVHPVEIKRITSEEFRLARAIAEANKDMGIGDA
ncbi:hypothetical protein [Pantoea sp. CTOTU46764]|uniref:hypothetical protein n=1 Tax=Pantoea sp. CTOTU46764 TaxID=2953854 RepID=UPI00289E1AAB|nr:hypothetical protein [Pantoea sp. CTOTU46764]